MGRKKENDYQCRAIIGSGENARYFLAWPEDQSETFVMPGSREIGREIIQGAEVRVFSDPVLVTYDQLKTLANKMRQPIICNKKFPVIRG